MQPRRIARELALLGVNQLPATAAKLSEKQLEEIEALGRQERRELLHRLGILVGHLLKWQLQPHLRGKSWRATITEQRRQIQRLLKDSPSLKPDLSAALQEAHQDGILLVVRETPLSEADLPAQCPYTFEQVMDPDFYPGKEDPQ